MTENKIKNDLLIRMLNGQPTERPPVWMMRQAGRYLPDYIKLRNKYSFFERVQTPELAAEITIMPVNQVGVDAAILFSDILVIPQAMGFDIELVPGVGPLVHNKIEKPEQVYDFKKPEVASALKYVFDAVKVTKEGLNNEVPLIGFAGAPWTILCYLVEGKGSKTFAKAKEFCFLHPKEAHHLLNVITETTIEYLKEKVKSGVDTVQLFDSWGGLLSPEDYKTFSFQYNERIIAALKEQTPVIAYPKGCWFSLADYDKTGAKAIGIDWLTNADFARSQVKNVALQGNFDPTRLLSPIPEIKKHVASMMNSFGREKYIANLGHGILPNVPVDHAKAFVDAVKTHFS